MIKIKCPKCNSGSVEPKNSTPPSEGTQFSVKCKECGRVFAVPDTMENYAILWGYNLDLSTNRITLGNEAKEKFRKYLWQFFSDACTENISTEAAKRELEEHYIEKFMSVINGED